MTKVIRNPYRGIFIVKDPDGKDVVLPRTNPCYVFGDTVKAEEPKEKVKVEEELKVETFEEQKETTEEPADTEGEGNQ